MTNPQDRLGFVGRHRIGVIAGLVALVYVALVVLGFFGAFALLADRQENSNAAFLPRKAESTRALAVQEGFVGKNVSPTIVLYERTGALTAEDQARVVQDLTLIRTRGWLVGDPQAPLTSADGKASQVYLPMDGQDVETFIEDVKGLRELLARPGLPEGLTAYVTGQGGVQADLLEVFGSIDSSLLLATLLIVIVILLVVYRSPVLWMLPLLAVGTAYVLAGGIISMLADADVLTVDGQSSGVLPVLVFGAGTDYALLLIARYREELHRYPRAWDAMKVALRGAVPPIVASAATVILGVLCLLASELSSNRGLGPVAAIGVAGAALTMIVLLPALLLVLGRRIFWPRVPHVDGLDPVASGMWARIASLVGRRTAATAVVSGLVLLVMAGFAGQLRAHGIPQSDIIRTQAESVVGQHRLEAHFPAGVGAPVDLIVPADKREAAIAVARATKGVVGVVTLDAQGGFTGPPRVVDGKVVVEALLSSPGDSPAATATIKALRKDLDAVSTDVLVGGFTALDLDIQDASQRDRRLILPLVLLVIFVVLAGLLRSLVAPLLLVGSVVLSFAATLGVCALVFNYVFDFPGADSAFPLFAFVFIVALGIDYNIFLMTRVREESAVLGTREGTLKGLTVTGGVITSAGLVLASTFAALGVLPLVPFAEIGFAVAFGVLLDTIIVRSLLVPALALMVGDRIWWPSRLATPPSEQ